MKKTTMTDFDAMLRAHEAKYARYFRFLDAFRATRDNCTIGAWIDALRAEFGIGEGEAHGAYLHWMVSRRDGGTPEERAKGMGGM